VLQLSAGEPRLFPEYIPEAGERVQRHHGDDSVLNAANDYSKPFAACHDERTETYCTRRRRGAQSNPICKFGKSGQSQLRLLTTVESLPRQTL